MNLDGALYLAASSQDVAKRDMRIKCLGIDLQRLGKGIDGTILTTVKQKIKSPVVLRGGTGTKVPKVKRPADRTLSQKPTQTDGHR